MLPPCSTLCFRRNCLGFISIFVLLLFKSSFFSSGLTFRLELLFRKPASGVKFKFVIYTTKYFLHLGYGVILDLLERIFRRQWRTSLRPPFYLVCAPITILTADVCTQDGKRVRILRESTAHCWYKWKEVIDNGHTFVAVIHAWISSRDPKYFKCLSRRVIRYMHQCRASVDTKLPLRLLARCSWIRTLSARPVPPT